MNRKIFISYSRQDIAIVRDIKEEIEQATGEKCWMDLEGIESGRRFTKVIIEAIESCEIFLFMRSAQSQSSKYALLELNYASEEANKKVVIINIDSSPLNKEFRFLYALTDTITWSDSLQHDKLIYNLKKWVETKDAIDTNVSIKEIPQMDRNPVNEEQINEGMVDEKAEDESLKTTETQFIGHVQPYEIKSSISSSQFSQKNTKKRMKTSEIVAIIIVFSFFLFGIAYSLIRKDSPWIEEKEIVITALCITVVASSLLGVILCSKYRPYSIGHYLRAVIFNEANSKYHMGLSYYFEGEKEKALKWLAKAAEQGHKEAKKMLENIEGI